ncbi:hypothetical protein CANARDRAFT_191146, partial [[Candida] arabinofermentans NRRL YB-2248]
MKVIFIYPLSYIFLWLFPFISQCYQLRNGHGNDKEFNNLWSSCTSAYFQAFNCTIDTIVFLYREQPWKLTSLKIDPEFEYNYSKWRLYLSFLPGYQLGKKKSSENENENEPDSHIGVHSFDYSKMNSNLNNMD